MTGYSTLAVIAQSQSLRTRIVEDPGADAGVITDAMIFGAIGAVAIEQ